MKTYRFAPENLKKQTNMLILMYSIPLVIMLVVVYFLNRGKPEMLTQTIILVVLMVGFYAYMGFRRYRDNVKLWKEYSLTIDENGVSQTQPNFPEVRIPKAEITAIEEVKNGFYVQTKSQGRVLGISNQLSEPDFEEIKQILSAWVTENEANAPAIGDEEDEDPALLDIPERVEEAIEDIEDDVEEAQESLEEEIDEVVEDLENELEAPTEDETENA